MFNNRSNSNSSTVAAEQNNQTSLLIDALGGGKRPTGRVTTTNTSHSRSHSAKSRERSLTPGLFSSPSSPRVLLGRRCLESYSLGKREPLIGILGDEEDAPPSFDLFSSTPQQYSRPSPSRPENLNILDHDMDRPRSLQSDRSMQSKSFYDSKPDKRSLYSTPHVYTDRPAMSPNTPTSLSQTVSVIGFPPNRIDMILELFGSYGPLTSCRKSEEKDGNWVVVSYLKRVFTTNLTKGFSRESFT